MLVAVYIPSPSIVPLLFTSPVNSTRSNPYGERWQNANLDTFLILNRQIMQRFGVQDTKAALGLALYVFACKWKHRSWRRNC